MNKIELSKEDFINAMGDAASNLIDRYKDDDTIVGYVTLIGALLNYETVKLLFK